MTTWSNRPTCSTTTCRTSGGIRHRRILTNANGQDEWIFQGAAASTPFGMAATSGWPPEEWGFDPATMTEMRPGCFDVHERVRDMNANGVLASMNFPTMAGFNARTFNEAPDKELSLVMLQAYNDWHIDEWCGAYPGRFIPQGIVPLWDVDLAVAEVQRVGCEGLQIDQLPRSTPCIRTPQPAFGSLGSHAGGDLRHQHGAFTTHRRSVEPDHPRTRSDRRSPHRGAITSDDAHRQDLLFGPTLRSFPELRVALSEGGIGWIPFYLDRVDRHVQNHSWIYSLSARTDCRRSCFASKSWRASSPTRRD